MPQTAACLYLALAAAAVSGGSDRAAPARRSLSGMPSQERAQLADAILNWLNDKIVSEQEISFHLSGGAQREDYPGYVAQLERHLVSRGMTRWVPLPAWDPDQEIPVEFLAASPRMREDSAGADPQEKTAGLSRCGGAAAAGAVPSFLGAVGLNLVAVA